MADPAGSGDRSSTAITDLNEDSLAHCTTFLDSLKDISNMAMSCRLLRSAAYSDSIWHRIFRNKWPHIVPSQGTGLRDAYMSRHTALQQFKFSDPDRLELYTNPTPCNHILLTKYDAIFSQGSLISVLGINSSPFCTSSAVRLSDHNARITCMRLFPLNETSLFGSKTRGSENILVTSSCDHSIRLWWKGCCHRSFKGHNGPVLSISDKLLGDGSTKVFASGGEDGTVRLWSLRSSGRSRQRSLKATLYGHERPVVMLSVASHKTSLLATTSKDSKVRLWDTSISSNVRSSSCVGVASVHGVPVGMKCNESLLYIGSGSSVVAIDLRSMQRAIKVAVHETKLNSFEILTSKSLICTGEIGKAMLWDIRKSYGTLNPSPIAELDGHNGAVTLLHMDSYKIVTGGPGDSRVKVWEADSGLPINSICCTPEEVEEPLPPNSCSAMAVDGCRIITACHGPDNTGYICLKDYTNAASPLHAFKYEPVSRFWEPQCYESDASDD